MTPKPLLEPVLTFKSIKPTGMHFNEILIEIQTFWLKKTHLKILSAKYEPFCSGLNVMLQVSKFQLWNCGSISLTVFQSQFKLMEISFCSYFDSNKVIATKVCTWHDSCTVVSCAKVCCDLMACSWIIEKQYFYWGWNTSKRLLVKWPLGPYVFTHVVINLTINYAHGFIMLCFVMVVIGGFMWFICPYSSGLLHWHWGKHMFAPVPVK